jgi:hypothetical protein
MKFNFWDNSKGETLPRAVRKIVSPSRTFKKKAKTRFLAAFDARHPVLQRTPQYVLVLRAFTVVVAVIAVALGGVSVYADTTNVPADNPLYSLKRLSESVQLAFTKVEAKPELEASFAVRRADEIAELEERHPTSTLLPGLAVGLGEALDDSIRGIEKEERPKNREKREKRPEQVQFQALSSSSLNATTSVETSTETNTSEKRVRAVCDTLQSAFDASSSFVRKEFSERSELKQRLNTRCRDSNDGEDQQGRGSHDATRSEDHTEDVTAPTSTTSTDVGTSTHENKSGEDDRGPLLL